MNLLRMNALLLANRQSPHLFSMESWKEQHICGTYACLIGNYALRPDLQSSFKIRRSPEPNVLDEFDLIWLDGPNQPPIGIGQRIFGGIWRAIASHFEITPTEAADLFAYDGCDMAGRDRGAALAYIEAFIARKLSERPLPEPEEPEEEPEPEEEEIAA